MVRRHWRPILVSAFIAVTVALSYGLFAQKWFRAQAIIAPVRQEFSSSELGGMSGQLGGLASLGLDLGGNDDLKKENLARLSSREFTYGFIRDEGLMPILFAAKWDAVQKHWKSNNEAKQPTLEEAFRYFIENVCTVSEDRRTGLIKITVDWKDPRLASEWANKLVIRINSDRRAVAHADAERNLQFLNRELERTNIIELRQAINRLIESETRKLMLADVREQYAFKVIDPAFVPGRKNIVKPRLSILAAVALFLGGAFGLVVAHVFSRMRAR